MRISEKQVLQMIINTKENTKKIFKEDFTERFSYKVEKKGLFRWGVIYRGNNRVFFFSSFFGIKAKKICYLMNEAYHFGTMETIRYFNEYGSSKN